MQSRRSGSMGTFLNPTILAMVGSVGFHGLLVISSALRPAEGQPSSLQVVSIAPQGSTLKVQKPGTLSVPNELPPINLGNIPQLPAAPDMSVAKVPPSQSLYVGSPSKAFEKLPIYNVPVQSFPNSSVPNIAPFGGPNSILGGVSPLGSSGSKNTSGLQSPSPSSDFKGAGSTEKFGSGDSTGGVPGYSVPRNSTLPRLTAEKFQDNSLYGRSTPLETPSISNPGSSSSTKSTTIGVTSDQARGQFKAWLQVQSQRYGQNISAQTGPRLMADYPSEACASRQEGVAVVAGLYGPDGAIVSSGDAVQVLQSADNMVLNRAAIAEVQRHRPNAAGVYQAFSFTVDVPYSAKICQAVQPEPSATTPPQPSSTESPLPSSQPTNTPVSQPSATPLSPEQPSGPPKAVPITPTEVPNETQQTPQSQPSPVTPSPTQTSAPEPNGGGALTPSPAESSSLEPLPSSSFSPAEPSPKP